MVLWLASAWFPTWLPPARSVTRAQAHMAVPPPQKARWHIGRHGAPESRRPRWPVHPHRHGQGQTGVSSERDWDGGREETWAFSGAVVPIHPHPTAGNQGPWPSLPPWAVTVPRALVSSSPSHEPYLGLVTAPSAWAAAGGSSLDPLPPLLATKGTWATGTGRPAPPPWLLWDTAFKTWAPLRAQTQERHRSKLLAAFRAGDTGV